VCVTDNITEYTHVIVFAIFMPGQTAGIKAATYLLSELRSPVVDEKG